jgi:hypothetical protein
MAQCFARAFDECFLSLRATEDVRADDANVIGTHVAQSLAESLQALERSRRDFLVEATVRFEPGAEANHLAQAIEDDELAVRIARDDHVETVGAEIDGGEDVRDGLRSAARHVSDGPSG